MKSTPHKLRIALRVILLVLTVFFSAWLLMVQENSLRFVYSLILPLVLGWDLIRTIDRSNRRILSFLNALKFDDHGIRLPGNSKDRIIAEIYATLNLLNQRIVKMRLEDQTRYQFMDTLAKKAKTGLLVVDREGKVHFVNDAFKSLTNQRRLKHGDLLSDTMGDHWESFQRMASGGKQTLDLKMSGGNKIVLVQYSVFLSESDTYGLYSVQDIGSEIQKTELETWKKLIRVLSHEILNSTSPILSLSESLRDILDEEGLESDPQKIRDGIHVIAERSHGLIRFTHAFSALAKLPPSEKEAISVPELLKRLKTLFGQDFESRNIDIEIRFMPGAEEIHADAYQLEQVLINLIKNAVEAFPDNQKDKAIRLSSYPLKTGAVIEIHDNGPGIPEDIRDKVFLPFFTSKPDGTGIGLAFAHQVMRQHQGSIDIEESGKGCRMILYFPGK